MKPQFLLSTLVTTTLCLTSIAIPESSYAQKNNKFFCGTNNGAPATLVRTTRGPRPMIRWTDRDFPPPWTPKQRCEEISKRFQRFYDNGNLEYIKPEMLKNGTPVLCVADRGGACRKNGVLITLKQGTDPQLVLLRITRPLASTPINLSGGKQKEVTPVMENINGEVFFNVEQFLIEAEKAVEN